MLDYELFKSELKNFVYDSKYLLTEKRYTFENTIFPDLEAVIFFGRVYSIPGNYKYYESIIKSIYKKMSNEQLSVFLERVKKYNNEPSEDNYKAVGEIIVPVTEKVIEEVNNNDLLKALNSKKMETNKNNSRLSNRWNWR